MKPAVPLAPIVNRTAPSLSKLRDELRADA